MQRNCIRWANFFPFETWSFFFQWIQLQEFALSYNSSVSCAWLKVYGLSVSALTKDYLLCLRVTSPYFSTWKPDRRGVSVPIWTRPRNQVIQGKETEFYICLKKVAYCFQKAKEDIHQHSLSTASKINHVYRLSIYICCLGPLRKKKKRAAVLCPLHL